MGLVTDGIPWHLLGECDMKKMKLVVCIALWTIVIVIGALAFWILAPGPSVTKRHPAADTSPERMFRDISGGLSGFVTPRKHGE